MKKIKIIGMGNMGMAIYGQLEEAGIFDVSGRDRDNDINKEIVDTDVLFIAVKPQSAKELFESIKIDLSDKLIISIMTGITIGNLTELSGSKKIIRSVPNMPAKIGKGVFGWIASESVGIEEKVLVKEMFSLMGMEIELENEELVDKVTAISGSGPAYFFYLVELLARKAREYGFSEDIAEDMAKMTFIGSGELLKVDDKTASELRESVTSKGGTTQAALNNMMDNGFEKIFLGGVDKARDRAEELNN